MNSPQQNSTSTSKYVPPQRRLPKSRSPTYRDQPYLIYEDLHARYSPNSPRLRMPHVQRSLSAEDLYLRFQQQKNQSESQPPNQEPNITSSPPSPLRNLETLKTYRPPETHQPLRLIFSLRLSDPPVFNNDRTKFED